MTMNLEVSKIEVIPLNKGTIAISWEFAPTLDTLNNYKVTLEKSESPIDGFEEIATIDASVKIYLDKNIKIFRFWKNYFVRIKIINKTTGETTYTDAYTIEYPPNIEALELIRRTKITLENKRFGNGVECEVFIRKTGGPRCQECYDALKKRSIKSNCENCYGTSYDGGYYKPIKTYINFSPDQKNLMVSDIGNISTSVHTAMLSNYPILKPGDLIVDRRLARIWTAEKISTVERRRHLIKQYVALKEEEKTSIVYKLLEN